MFTVEIKYIYFDLDDTLLDHETAQEDALKDVYHHYPLLKEEEVDYETFKRVYGRVNKRLWLGYARNEIERPYLQFHRFYDTLGELKLGLSEQRQQELTRQMGDYYLGRYQYKWRWNPGAEEAYHKISNEYRVGIMTNGFAGTQHKKFELFGLDRTAEHLVIAEEVGVMKPQPGIFEHALKLTGQAPGEVLFVGDSYHDDIQGGHSQGWQTAWYNPNSKAPEDPQSVADFEFGEFEALGEWLAVSTNV